MSNIQAHVGGAAAEACGMMGAEAYATGNRVAFKRQPDIRTAAHEAAHIVQQRVGVSLPGGVGQRNDPYEHHANAVAERVVRGQSAGDLLQGAQQSPRESPPRGPAAGIVQRQSLDEATVTLRVYSRDMENDHAPAAQTSVLSIAEPALVGVLRGAEMPGVDTSELMLVDASPTNMPGLGPAWINAIRHPVFDVVRAAFDLTEAEWIERSTGSSPECFTVFHNGERSTYCPDSEGARPADLEVIEDAERGRLGDGDISSAIGGQAFAVWAPSARPDALPPAMVVLFDIVWVVGASREIDFARGERFFGEIEEFRARARLAVVCRAQYQEQALESLELEGAGGLIETPAGTVSLYGDSPLADSIGSALQGRAH